MFVEGKGDERSVNKLEFIAVPAWYTECFIALS